MQGSSVETSTKLIAGDIWSEARDAAVDFAKQLDSIGIHKQNANRLLEPFMHMKVILTGTDFSNWFELRDHPDAQPEIQELARAMRKALAESEAKYLEPGMWHVPFVGSPAPVPEGMEMMEYVLKTSVARCARISYDNVDGSKSTTVGDLELYNDLITKKPLHASPAEHQAKVPTENDLGDGHLDSSWVWIQDSAIKKWIKPNYYQETGKYFSNLRGWIQLRKLIEAGEFK